MQNSGTALRLRIAASVFCIACPVIAGCASAPRRPDPSRTPLAQLRTDIAAATEMPGVSRASWGVVVESLDRDERLFEMQARTLFVPASVAKIVSVATAADAVGWDYRFETSLLAAGTVSYGTLAGDVVIVGSGDPSIGGRGGGDLSALVAAVKAAGISRIDGRIIGDDNALEEPRPQLSWAWDDLGYTTGAIFGALNVAENRTVVTVAPAPEAGAPATISLDARAARRPLINRAMTAQTGTPALLWPEQRPGETSLTIAGSIPAGSQPLQLGISTGNPTVWFASVLKNRLVEEGIAVTGEAVDIDDLPTMPDRSSVTELIRYRSPTLAEIARPLLKDSINLYAEAFLRLNSAAGLFPTNDAALAGLQQRLTAWGVPGDGYQLVDGSGLSRRNAISPEAVMIVLRRMSSAPGSQPFLDALPVAGVDGSLASRMRGTAAEGKVRAKTGTMSNIRSLAGYAATRDGERLAFAILINNFEGTGAQAHQAIDAIAVRLAEFSRSSR